MRRHARTLAHAHAQSAHSTCVQQVRCLTCWPDKQCACKRERTCVRVITYTHSNELSMSTECEQTCRPKRLYAIACSSSSTVLASILSARALSTACTASPPPADCPYMAFCHTHVFTQAHTQIRTSVYVSNHIYDYVQFPLPAIETEFRACVQCYFNATAKRNLQAEEAVSDGLRIELGRARLHMHRHVYGHGQTCA